jgi:hypothetical protein
MDLKKIRRATVLATLAFVLSATAVFADTVPADGDFTLPGNQASVDLGARGPGETITREVSFSLVCSGTSHPADGATITVQPSALSQPADGTIVSTSTTIGPIPASWPDNPAACPSPGQPVLAGNGPVTITLKTPTTPGIDYQFTIIYARVGASGFTGTTAINFTVDVVVNTPPTLSLPAPITVEATGASGATVSYAVSATDAEDDPDPTPTCSPASGATFQLGTTNVSCSVTDSGGLAALGAFPVTVRDTTGPRLTVPGAMTVEATETAGAVVTFSASAIDAVDPAPIVDCTPPSGQTFALGTTTVDCTATDASGNQSSGSFAVTVADTTAPALTLPESITVEASGATGANVDYAASATDAVDPAPVVDCVPSSGSTFPSGTTAVDCTATDASGNQSSGSFDVYVGDAGAPTLNLPGTVVEEASGPSGAAVSYSATASDTVDPAPVVDCLPASGSMFGLGTTSVECTATDSIGNQSAGSFDVVVRDTTAPSMSDVPADVSVAAPTPAGQSVSYATPTATDAVSGDRPVDCSPASGSTFPVGTTSVTCTASDAAGNAIARSFTITVTYDNPTAEYAVEWGEPISGGTLTANPGRTVPLKIRVSVDGAEKQSGEAYLSIAPCGGGDVVATVPLTFSGGRWMGHIDTGALNPGCYSVTLVVDGYPAGSFTLDLSGPDPASSPNPKRDKPK